MDLCALVGLLGLFAQGAWRLGGPDGIVRLDGAGVPAWLPAFLTQGSAWVPLLILIVGAMAVTNLVAHRANSRWMGAAVGALWVVHPLWGEALVWRTSMGPLLSMPLLCVAHLSLWRCRTSGMPTIGWVAFALAVACWPGALAYGLVLAFELRARRRATLAFLVVCAAAALVWWMQGTSLPGDPSAASQLAAGAACVTAALRALVWPAPGDLGMEASVAWSAPPVWGGLALCGVALVCMVRARPTSGWMGALVCAAALAAPTLLPARAPVLSHAGLALWWMAAAVLVATLLRRASFWRTLALGACVAVLAVTTGLRAGHLGSAPVLWEAARAHDDHPRVRLALARWALTSTPARAAVARTLPLPASASPAYKVEGALLRCDALFRDGDHAGLLDEATEALTRARDLPASYQLPAPGAARSQAFRFHGDALMETAGRRAALDAYRQAVLHDETNVEALIRLGRALAGTGDEGELAEGVDALDRAVTAAPHRVDAVRALARAHVLLRDPASAFRVLDRAQRVLGETPDLLFARARAHLSGTRNVAKAETLLRRIQELDPGRSHEEAATLQAEIHVAVGRRFLEQAAARAENVHWKDALARFDAALRAAPSHWQAHVFAGDALVAMQRYDDARARYQRALDAQPAQRWVRRLLAHTALLHASHPPAGASPAEAARHEAQWTARAIHEAHRLDLGMLPLASELPMLRRVAQDLDDPALAPRAQVILQTVREALFGRDEAAMEALASSFAMGGADKAQAHLLDASLLLRALLYERHGNLIEARRDYQLLAERRPDDGLPTLRKLQIEMRIALAQRATARAFPNDKQRLERTEARVARIAERVLAYTLAHPDRLDVQLAAVEADMHRGRWIESLARLNRMRRDHPDDASVLRGLATVYMEHHAASGDGDLLIAAGRHVREALTLDPRDMRALLDQAQIAAKAQDFGKAIRFAQEARRFDPLPRGPATRLLGTLHLARARRMLEGGQAEAAMDAVRTARQVDPANADSYLCEGEVLLAQAGGAKAARLQSALEAGRRAKELAPFGRDVDAFLARIHRELGFAALLEMRRVHPNPDPRTDPAFATLSEAEQAKRVKRHEALAQRNAKRRSAYRDLALEHYDQALALEPTGDDADLARQRASTLRANDPTARRQRMLDAQAAYERGRKLHATGDSLGALRAYREAVALDRNHVRAHAHLIQAAYQNLVGIRMDVAEEKRLANDRLSAALRSLHALDALDTESRFPERWYFRGQLNRWMYRRLDSEPSRHAARAAYQRFLSLKAGTSDATNAPLVARARVHLDALTRKGE